MEKSSLTAFPKNRNNPFIESAIQDIKIIKKTQFINPKDSSEISMIVNNSNGEVQGYTQFLRFIEVDEEKFAKVYLSQFEAFWELPKSAIRVFGYMINNLRPHQDKIEFILEDCIKYTRYKSRQTIYTGLAALISNGIVARGYNEYVYFLNPLVAFNGDRVAFAKILIKKKNKDNTNAIELPFAGLSNKKNSINQLS